MVGLPEVIAQERTLYPEQMNAAVMPGARNYPQPCLPAGNIQSAIESADKAACVVGEKLELLGQRLAFVLQPESPALACGRRDPMASPPKSDAVARLEDHAARLMNLADRIGGYLDRLDV